MRTRPWLAVSALAIATALATRLKPGPLPDAAVVRRGDRARPARPGGGGWEPERLGLPARRRDAGASRGRRGGPPSLYGRRGFSPPLCQQLGRLKHLRY